MSVNSLLIGSRVKEFRRRSRFTQETLAEHTNLSVKYIGSLENGRKGARIGTVLEIAAALGVTVDLLLLGSHDSEITIQVCEFAELIIGRNTDERNTILNAAIAMAESLRREK